MTEGGPLVNATIAQAHIFAHKPLLHARMVAGGVALALMSCEGCLVLVFNMHPILREISAVDGLHKKLSLLREPADCLEMQQNTVSRFNRLNQKLSRIATP
jgi:hypothetical protein